jgi:hypothetical protein
MRQDQKQAIRVFRVIHYFTTSEVYEIEASSEQDALDIAASGTIKPIIKTSPKFSDEMVELVSGA